MNKVSSFFKATKTPQAAFHQRTRSLPDLSESDQTRVEDSSKTSASNYDFRANRGSQHTKSPRSPSRRMLSPIFQRNLPESDMADVTPRSTPPSTPPNPITPSVSTKSMSLSNEDDDSFPFKPERTPAERPKRRVTIKLNPTPSRDVARRPRNLEREFESQDDSAGTFQRGSTESVERASSRNSAEHMKSSTESVGGSSPRKTRERRTPQRFRDTAMSTPKRRPEKGAGESRRTPGRTPQKSPGETLRASLRKSPAQLQDESPDDSPDSSLERDTPEGSPRRAQKSPPRHARRSPYATPSRPTNVTPSRPAHVTPSRPTHVTPSRPTLMSPSRPGHGTAQGTAPMSPRKSRAAAATTTPSTSQARSPNKAPPAPQIGSPVRTPGKTQPMPQVGSPVRTPGRTPSMPQVGSPVRAPGKTPPMPQVGSPAKSPRKAPEVKVPVEPSEEPVEEPRPGPSREGLQRSPKPPSRTVPVQSPQKTPERLSKRLRRSPSVERGRLLNLPASVTDDSENPSSRRVTFQNPEISLIIETPSQKRPKSRSDLSQDSDQRKRARSQICGVCAGSIRKRKVDKRCNRCDTALCNYCSCTCEARERNSRARRLRQRLQQISQTGSKRGDPNQVENREVVIVKCQPSAIEFIVLNFSVIIIPILLPGILKRAIVSTVHEISLRR